MDTNYSSGASDKSTTPGTIGSTSSGSSMTTPTTTSGTGASGAAGSGAGSSGSSSDMGSYSSQGAGGGYYDEQSRSNQQTGSSSMRDELNSMKSDLDSLLSKASSLTDRQLRAARDQMMTKFGSMRYSAKDMASEAGKQLNRSMDVTTDYVKDKPLQAVAIAAGIGLLIGALLRRS